MQISVIINRCRNTLLDQDSSAYAWTDNELIDYLSQANSAIVFVKPDANAVTANLNMVAGVLQSLPDDGVQILDVTRNIASGLGVRFIDRDHLVQADPNWARSALSAVDVQHYMPDPRNPRKFHIYPYNNASGQVEIVYSANPTRMAALSDTFPLPDVYEAAAHAHVVALAYAKNSKRGDVTKSQYWHGVFGELLGVRDQKQFGEAPRGASKQES